MSEETTAPAEAPADETAALMAADDILWGNADAEAPEAEVADGEEAPAEAAPPLRASACCL